MKRTTSIITFAHQLSALQDRLKGESDFKGKPPRIVRIESPISRGPVTVIFQRHGEPVADRAVTLGADGQWSGVSYWHEEQI